MKGATKDAALWSGFWALFAVCVLFGAWSAAGMMLAGAILGRVL